MANTGGVVLTPIPAPGAAISGIGQPLPRTILSLDRFAKIMGINPAHFWGTAAPDLSPQVFPVVSNCTAIWHKYSWQDSDRVGHYDLAVAIYNAEQDLARVLGYFPGPIWIGSELQEYPRNNLPGVYDYGRDIRGRFKSIVADYGEIFQVGPRAVSLVGTATAAGGTLAYTDEDSDGLIETATITLPTALTDVRQIKVYHTGKDGTEEWEIREVRSKTITGGNVVITLDSWLLVDPDLYEQYPTEEGPPLVNISTTSNFVTSVDVYREYADTTDYSVKFLWEDSAVPCNGTDCDDLEQGGCLRIRDDRMGVVGGVPASYSADDGSWSAQAWSGSRAPDRAKLWYRSGLRSDEYIRGTSLVPLSPYWEQTIAWLAVTRLERPFCSCGNLVALNERLSLDKTQTTREMSFFVNLDQVKNPFGTRVGELAVWNRVSQLVRKRPKDVPVL